VQCRKNIEAKLSNEIQISLASIGPMEEGANSSNINKAYKFYRGCVRGLAGVFNNLSKIFVVSEVVLHKCFHYKREG
jgi:hypothetical protein